MFRLPAKRERTRNHVDKHVVCLYQRLHRFSPCRHWIVVRHLRLVIQSNLQVFNPVVRGFYCEYALHEWCSMVRFGAFPFTRTRESMRFCFTVSLDKLNKCIRSKLEKDRKLSRDNCGILKKSQKLQNAALPADHLQWWENQNNGCLAGLRALLHADSVNSWCAISNYQEYHAEWRIIWKSCSI